MSNLRISLTLILLSLCQFVANAQKGNYAIRDSTLNLPFVNNNTIVGTKAAQDLNNSTYTGGVPGRIVGSDNSIFGSYAGFKLGTNLGTNTVNGVTLIGSKAGYNYSSESRSLDFATFIGAFAGYNRNDTGGGDGGGTLIGYKAGYGGSFPESISIGVEAGLSGVSPRSIFIGNQSGAYASGNTQGSVFLGHYTGQYFSSIENTIIGDFAGTGTPSSTGGAFNVIIGSYAGNAAPSNDNTFVGANAGKVSINARDTFIGSGAGKNAGNANYLSGSNTFVGYAAGGVQTLGLKNTFLGYGTDGITSPQVEFIENSVAIGYNAKVSASNSFILGGTGSDAVKVGIGNTAPNNRLEITSATTNTSGLRFTNLKSTSTPSTANSLALSVDANGDVILVPAATGGLTNPVTNLQVLSGTAGVSGLRLNNLPLTTTAAAPNGKTLSVDATGNVILVTAPAGFTNPVTNLQVLSGTAGVSGLTLTNVNSASATTTANGKVLSVDATGNVILVPATAAVLPAGADVWDQLTNGADYLIRNKNNKSVMIGTVAATKTSIDYKLYVEKGILAEKVKVSANANWPDYVFGKDYSLMPLKEVESYITTNNHLPEVPSAEVIAKDGLDLGKMDATLLKKVEELTLYLIEQSKEIQMLKKKVIVLESKK